MLCIQSTTLIIDPYNYTVHFNRMYSGNNFPQYKQFIDNWPDRTSHVHALYIAVCFSVFAVVVFDRPSVSRI